MASTTPIGEIRITDLSRAHDVRSSDIFLAATHLDGSASITTQGVSANLMLNYMMENGPYTIGPNLSCLGFDNFGEPIFVTDNTKEHYNILPSHPKNNSSIESIINAPNCA